MLKALPGLLMEDTLCIIEWPDKFIDMLPQEYIIIEISIIDDASREFKLLSTGAIHHKILIDIQSAVNAIIKN